MAIPPCSNGTVGYLDNLNRQNQDLIQDLKGELHSGDIIQIIVLAFSIPATLFAVYKLLKLMLKLRCARRVGSDLESGHAIEKDLPSSSSSSSSTSTEDSASKTRTLSISGETLCEESENVTKHGKLEDKSDTSQDISTVPNQEHKQDKAIT